MRQTVDLKNRLAKSSLLVWLILIAATAALDGCGGSGSASSARVETGREALAAAPDPATARRAEIICRRATAEAAALLANLAEEISRAPSAEQGIDAGLVRPGIRILEREASAFDALHPERESAAFATFVGLYEPVISLAHQRLASGEAGEVGTDQELEQLAESLTTEQTRLAAALGLGDCETDFFEALGTAR